MHRGFTLFELLIVLALITVIAGFSAYGGIGSYQQILIREDQEHTAATGRAAQEKAMHHVCDGAHCTDAVAHGIHSTATSSTLFQGPSFAARNPEQDRVFPALSLGSTTGSVDTLYFPSGASSTQRY